MIRNINDMWELEPHEKYKQINSCAKLTHIHNLSKFESKFVSLYDKLLYSNFTEVKCLTDLSYFIQRIAGLS
jgi:hypothetical protein